MDPKALGSELTPTYIAHKSLWFQGRRWKRPSSCTSQSTWVTTGRNWASASHPRRALRSPSKWWGAHASAPFLVLAKLLRKESSSTAASYQRNSLVKVLCFGIVFRKKFVTSILQTLDHSVKLLGLFWHWSSLRSVLLTFSLLPFVYAAWNMNTNASSPKLLTANIAHNGSRRPW